MGERLPVIYVRGFGGGQSGIDRAVDDPFYGLNEGSTHIRVGDRGTPRFYQFEGPLVRLLLEQGYRPLVGGGQEALLLDSADESLEPTSVWVYRFYDKNAATFGAEPAPYRIEESAEGLAAYIELVLRKTKGADRVNLVAHSMGGLICRSALQRYLVHPERTVSKLVTIGTPHGGIDPTLGGSIGDWVMDRFGPNGADIFQPRRMKEYLLPEGDDGAGSTDPRTGDWDPRRLVGDFPVSRVLSIVGTNAHDYEVAHGLSRTAMGPQSDGLVAVRNAYVRGSARAYVHRSHSGRYGLVNSEEVYQNLRRFLFGSLRVELGFRDLDLDRTSGRVWQAEARLAVRGIPVLMHEQTAANFCPIDLAAEEEKRPTPTAPMPLVTTFLHTSDRAFMRYALQLKVISLEQRGGVFGFFDHLEQTADWEDTLVVDVKTNDEGLAEEVRWQWNSALAGRIAERPLLEHRLEWEPGRADNWKPSIPLPDLGRQVLGAQAALELAVSRWE
ncbi:MAG: alpha/beta fold hydrolase [Geodermatophilaceae bacterium]|nr:alpha/beta fold hydrolase [Geodermatophilaceae bacterium]